MIDGLRAMTYLLHHLAPIFLLCDIRDLGSWLGDTTPATSGAVATRESTKRRLMSADQFNPTIYLYDSHAGGIGLAEHLFEVLPDLLAPRARDPRDVRLPRRLSLVRRARERSGSPGQDARRGRSCAR